MAKFVDGLFFATQCVRSKTEVDAFPPPTWRGVTIGSTSLDEVKSLLGNPPRQEETLSGMMAIGYPDDEGRINAPHWIYIDPACECVVFIQEKVIPYSVVLSEVLEEFGEPEVVLGYEGEYKRGLFVYASQGFAVAVQSQQTPLTRAAVYDFRYFMPMTVEQMLEQPWAHNSNNWVPTKWEKYQYHP